MKAVDKGRTVESVLAEASQALSGLSRGAGVVLAGKADVRLKHIEFIRIEPTRALVVLVGEDGSVENRLVDLDPGTTPSALIEAGNYLNAHLRGRTLAEARADLERRAAARARRARQAHREARPGGARDLGASRHRPAGDADRARPRQPPRGRHGGRGPRAHPPPLRRPRDAARADQLLGLAEPGEGVRIFIGSENKLFSLSGSSLVVAPYRDSEQRIVGVLGVIGPTRLNYARIVPMVDYTAKVVGRLLG